MRHISYAWGFGAAWMYVTTGAALTQYAKLLGTPEYAFGILAALPFAGSLLQLPASWIISRYGFRKPLFLASGLLHRMLWFAIAAIPLWRPGSNSWVALIGLLGLSSVAGHIASPAVLAWFGDVVPKPLRGRYFGRRAQLGQLSGLATTLLVGYLLDLAKVSEHLTLQGTLMAMLAGSAVLGTIDFLILAPLPDPKPGPMNRSLRMSEVLRGPLRNPNFRRYLGFSATFTFAVGYVGQYVWLFIFDVVKYSNSKANILLVSVPLVVAMVCLPLWGRAVDRFGRRPVMILSGLCLLHGAAGWILLAGPTAWLGVVLALSAMAAWPGIDLGSMNLLFGLSNVPELKRQDSAYVAVNSVVTALAGIASGAFGGLMAKWLAGWETVILGTTLTYHGILFLISGVFRLLSLLWLAKLDDPGSSSVRATARAMVEAAVHALREGIAAPKRQLEPLTKRSHARSERPKRAA